MKNTIDNTLVSEIKIQISSPDLYPDYKFDLLGKERYESACDKDGVQLINNGECTDQCPFSIKKLREILDTLEEKGSNYISIDYNYDHPDYTFYGVDIHVASQLEIDEKNEKDKQTQLSEINKSLIRLEKEKEKILKIAENLKNGI